MKRVLGGLASLVVLAGLLAGIPALLIWWAGNPIPSWDELSLVLTGPDLGGQFLMGTVVPIIGWIAWLFLAAMIVLEVASRIRRMPTPSLPGLALPQRGASMMVGAVIAMFAVVGGAGAATAAELPATPSVSQSIVQGSSTTPAPATQADDEVSTTPAAQPTYTVQDGDSLWRIAEIKLGDGKRWPEIAALNYGVEQGDGWALTDQHWLNSGWVLTLPADAAAPAAATEATTHTVVSGETLSGIAQANGSTTEAVFAASQGIVQPGGAHLSDPDLILPGWTLAIPGAQVATPAPVDETAPVEETAPVQETAPVDEAAPAPADPTAGAEGEESTTAAPDLSGLGLGTPAPTSSEAPAEAAPVVDDVDEESGADWIDEIFNVRTLGGLGAIAAAGLLSLLGIRRMKQRRRRGPGQRIAMPSGEASTMELELRAVENPLGMEHVDHALRYLAVWAQDSNETLPPLYALRLADEEIALYLDAPRDLPAPFTPVTEDRMAWTVDPEQLPELDRVPSAPWPALVTLGQDQGDAHLLLDLEHIGALNLTGNPESVDGALTGLAVELATSQWADDLQVTLVGVAPGLPAALDTGRIRHIDDVDALLHSLRTQASSTEQTLSELGVETIEEARSLGAFAEAWTPEIVILGEMPAEPARSEIADLVTRVPRVGVAAIATGELAGEWTMHLTDDRTAELNIPSLGASLPLTPQIVNQDELRRIEALFRTTEEEAVQVYEAREEVPIDDIPTLVDEAAQDVDEEQIAQPEISDADSTPVQSAPTTESAPEVPIVVDETDDQDVDDELEEIVATVGDGRSFFREDVPWVQILGTVQLHNPQGEEPRTPQTSKVNRSAVNRSTELLTFLALNPGASAVEVHAALWPGKIATGKKASDSRNGLASKARKWVGDSADEREWFPKVGARGYRLQDEIRTDWHVFQELIGDDVTKTTTEDLVDALKLVKGQPFSGVPDKYYVWADDLRTEIIQAIGDAAHELVTRSLRTGRVAEGRLAAAIGRKIEPENEIRWRDAMRIETLAGSRNEFERVVSRHEIQLDTMEDGHEPEPETAELIKQIRERLPQS